MQLNARSLYIDFFESETSEINLRFVLKLTYLIYKKLNIVGNNLPPHITMIGNLNY